jgi:uncharacterized protein YecT (DUF1311 family)
MILLRAALFAVAAASAQAQTPPQTETEPQAQTPPVHVAVPSFDCNVAKSVVEKEICAIPDFADLDSRIAALYTQALSIVSPRDGDALRADQRVWLRERDDCGNLIHGNPPIDADVYACLRDRLNRREAFLRVVVASKQFTKP